MVTQEEIEQNAKRALDDYILECSFDLDIVARASDGAPVMVLVQNQDYVATLFEVEKDGSISKAAEVAQALNNRCFSERIRNRYEQWILDGPPGSSIAVFALYSESDSMSAVWGILVGPNCLSADSEAAQRDIKAGLYDHDRGWDRRSDHPLGYMGVTQKLLPLGYMDRKTGAFIPEATETK